MTSSQWIPISIFSEDGAERIDKAIDVAYRIHVWTLKNLSEQYKEHKFVPDISDYMFNLTRFLREEKLYRDIQRYTADQAMLQTIRWFRDTDKYTGWDVPFPPEPFTVGEYSEIDIKSRKIWKKYLELYGQVSTIFGMLMLGDRWKEMLQQQAQEMKVIPEKLPSHWRSLTIKREDGGYKIRFNG